MSFKWLDINNVHSYTLSSNYYYYYYTIIIIIVVVGISSKDKHLGCSPCKILRSILEVVERRTSTNGPENKKTNDDA